MTHNMDQLHIKVSSPAMPISTEFVRFCKAVEQFYYAIAIASEPDLAKAAAAWRAWLANGLNPAVKLAPPVDGRTGSRWTRGRESAALTLPFPARTGRRLPCCGRCWKTLAQRTSRLTGAALKKPAWRR